MKLSLVSLAVLLSAGIVAAAPNPDAAPIANPWGWGHHENECCPCPKESNKPKKPLPKAPSVTIVEIVQICGNGNSPHCCNGQSGGKTVTWMGDTYSAQCSAINVGNYDASANVQGICSTTVACCIGDNCHAVAN